MKILVINSGSSSLRFQFVDTKTEKVLAKGHIDGIGQKTCRFIFKKDKKSIQEFIKVKKHKDAVEETIKKLIRTQTITDLKDIERVGHRVVHGGEKFIEPTIIDKSSLKELEQISYLAPLHNPANLKGIDAFFKILKNTPQVAIFDTAYFKTLPQKAYTYALPLDTMNKYHIRKYGFHGTSHEYVTKEAIKTMKKKNLKIISCHLGNGSSLAASVDGKAVETSMGFTPMDGVMMGTRAGSIDPGIFMHLIQKGMSVKRIDQILNFESGLLGLSKISSDMRFIYSHSLKKNKNALFCLEILSYQIAKYIGAYTAAMNGLDAIIFTGGIGENAFYIREKVSKYLEFLKVSLDKKKNNNCTEKPKVLKDSDKVTLISDKKSKVKVFVIPTNEEMEIAKKTALCQA